MWEFFGESGLKYIKNCQCSKYRAAKNLNLFIDGDDDDPPTFVKQHWSLSRPVYERVYTGNERGRQWHDNPIGTQTFNYPDDFDDIVWEYAQSERDAAEKDVLAYATWWSSKKQYLSSVSIPGGATWSDNVPPPSLNISAEKIGEFKKRLFKVLHGRSTEEDLLKSQVNGIMNSVRLSARKIGKAKAKTNPLVEEVRQMVDIDDKVPD